MSQISEMAPNSRNHEKITKILEERPHHMYVDFDEAETQYAFELKSFEATRQDGALVYAEYDNGPVEITEKLREIVGWRKTYLHDSTML